MTTSEYNTKKTALMSKGLTEQEVIEIIGVAPQSFAEVVDGYLILRIPFTEKCTRVSAGGEGKSFIHASSGGYKPTEIIVESGEKLKVMVTAISRM